jgi:hypothetical protein
VRGGQLASKAKFQLTHYPTPLCQLHIYQRLVGTP